MKYRICWVVAAALLVALSARGDVKQAAKPMPIKELRGTALDEARAARNRADLLLADLEKRMLESRRAEGRLQFTDAEKKRFDPEITEVIQCFQDIIERFPHTEISCYCAKRIAGFYQFQGKFDAAVQLMQDTAIVYAGTPEEAKLWFEIGLMEAQARNDQVAAIRWLSRVPKPKNAPAEDRRDVNPLSVPEQQQLFLAAQQQIVKAGLKLGLDEQARKRLDALKQEFPKHAEELDRFYQFEQKSIATGGATFEPPEGFTIPEIAEEKPQLPDADKSLEEDVYQLGRLKHGPEQDAAIAALAKQGDAAVAEIERQIGKENPDFGIVHSSVRVLKAIDSEASRNLLRRIARGDFQLENPNQEPWAATNLIALDKNEGWALLCSANQGVLTTALNAIEGQTIDAERLASVINCLKHENNLVRWRAAEVLATTPRGTLADEAFDAISQTLIAVADLPNRDELDQKGLQFGIDQTLGEMNYGRFLNALSKIKVDDRALHKLAEGQKGRTRDAIILALAKRYDRSVSDQIVKMTQDPEAGLFRAWAVHRLADVGTTNDLPLLRKIAKEDPLVRKGPLPPLQGLHARGPIFPVREAAVDAIRRIEKRKKEAGKSGAT